MCTKMDDQMPEGDPSGILLFYAGYAVHIMKKSVEILPKI